MEQGADKHSARLDDEMKHATEGMVRAGRSTRAEEWRDPEPSGEDEPDVDRAPDSTLTGGTPDGMTATDVELRSELASYLDRSTFPAVRAQLMEQATENHAPERVLDEIRRLPDGREYVNVNDIWSTLGGGTEQHRF
jgi:hypothetical protein